jgi:hypothetical protein
MFVPFTQEAITKSCNSSTILIRREDSGTYVARMRTFNEIKDLATFNVLTASDMVGVSNFKLAGVVQNCPSKYKHLYLVLILRELVKWSKRNGMPKLAVHTKEVLLPEIFLDEGFKIRHSIRTGETVYRGTKYV